MFDVTGHTPHRGLAALTACLVSFASATADDRAASVGVWKVVAVEMGGRQIDADFISRFQVAYRDDGSWEVFFKRLLVGAGASRNDEDASPKTFEMEVAGAAPTNPARYVGIYRVEGNTRQLCFVPDGRPRPDTFAAPRGSGRILVTLKRATRAE